MRKTVDAKKRIIAGLIEKSGDIKAACKFARVKSTKSYYHWLGNDPNFKEATEVVLSRFRKPKRSQFEPRDRRTIAQKKAGFLAGYEFMNGNISKAAIYGRVSDKSFYNWMNSDENFANEIGVLDRERLLDLFMAQGYSESDLAMLRIIKDLVKEPIFRKEVPERHLHFLKGIP